MRAILLINYDEDKLLVSYYEGTVINYILWWLNKFFLIKLSLSQVIALLLNDKC